MRLTTTMTQAWSRPPITKAMRPLVVKLAIRAQVIEAIQRISVFLSGVQVSHRSISPPDQGAPAAPNSTPGDRCCKQRTASHAPPGCPIAGAYVYQERSQVAPAA